MKKLKYHTILDTNNRNTDGTHLLHKILPVRNLQNYKNTPLSRFFPSPAIGTDQQNLLPSYNLRTKHIFQNSPTDSFGILSTLTSSDEQRDSYSISQKNSQPRNFRMYNIVYRPHLPPSTTFRCSFSNDVLLPLAKKPRINEPRTSTYQKNTILQFLKPSKKTTYFVHSPNSPHYITHSIPIALIYGLNMGANENKV